MINISVALTAAKIPSIRMGYAEFTGTNQKKERMKKLAGQKELFLRIWDEREHICTNCGVHLGDEPLAQFFSHIIPKSRGIQYRLDPDNIQLLCFTCHQLFDHGTKAQFQARAKSL